MSVGRDVACGFCHMPYTGFTAPIPSINLGPVAMPGSMHFRWGLGTMVAYAGTFSLGDNVVVHHIDTSWNQAWTGTNQIRHFVLDGDVLTITTAPYKSYLDGTMGRSILVWNKVR